jgi:hypothetical protein
MEIRILKIEFLMMIWTEITLLIQIRKMRYID